MPSDPLAGIGREMPLAPSQPFAPLPCRPSDRAACAPADAGALRYAAALADAAPHARFAAAIGDALCATPPVLHATFVLPGLGRFDARVADEPDAVRLRLQCHTATGHAWLGAHRHTIEQRLARRLDRRVVLTTIEAPAALAP